MREGPGAAGLPTDVDEVLAPALSEFEAAESIAMITGGGSEEEKALPNTGGGSGVVDAGGGRAYV